MRKIRIQLMRIVRYHERCDTSNDQGSQQGGAWQDRMESAGKKTKNINKQTNKQNSKQGNVSKEILK